MPAVQAADVNQLKVGEGWYLDRLASFELVYVTEIDRASNRVRVRRDEDNVVEWVSASRLVTYDEMIVISVDRGFQLADAAIELFEYLTEEDDSDECDLPFGCDGYEEYSGVFSDATPAESEAPSKFKIVNNCEHPIRLALRYKETGEHWNTIWWWEVPGNAIQYLATSDGVQITTTADYYFYYAEGIDTSLTTVGEHNFVVDGETVGMTMANDSSGDRDFSLSCDGM